MFVLKLTGSAESSENICNKYFRKWGLKTYQKSGKFSEQSPQRKRSAAKISTEDGDEHKTGPPAQGIPARAALLPLRPSGDVVVPSGSRGGG